ncbi:MAG: hypothetical protein K8S27_12720 [Candidatus Omnitrophica bacterium]|nr:hypothetical protein [Candidatus Omnitrophota bacterium]
MSIINDALNKAKPDDDRPKDPKDIPSAAVAPNVTDLYKEMHQTENTPKPAAPKPANGAKNVPPEELKKNREEAEERLRKRRTILTAVFGMIFVAAISISLVAFVPSLRDNFKKVLSKKNGSKKRKIPVRTYQPGDIIFSGTIVAGDKTVALINDSVYEEGDTISGKKILSISLEKLELEDEQTGKLSVLRN